MIEGTNRAGTERVLVGYLDGQGNFIPVDIFNTLPVEQPSTSMRVGVYVVAGSAEPKYKISTAGWAVIQNISNMFDGNFSTSAYWDFSISLVSGGTSPSAYIHFGGDGYQLSSILIYSDVDLSTAMAFTAKDVTGKQYTLTLTNTSIDIAGTTYNLLSITGFPTTEIVEIEFHSTGRVEADVFEMRVLKQYAFNGNIQVQIPSQSDIITYDELQEIDILSGGLV